MSTAARKSRILIAADTRGDAEQLEADLNGLGYEIVITVVGGDTLETVASFQPDLIVLDIAMPESRGLEICQQLKDGSETRRIMILLVAGLSEFSDIERAVEAGTDDFLGKPILRDELLVRVRNLLGLRHQRPD